MPGNNRCAYNYLKRDDGNECVRQDNARMVQGETVPEDKHANCVSEEERIEHKRRIRGLF